MLTARDQDYAAFYEHEIGFRRSLRYPPYSRLIQVLVRGRNKDDTARCAQTLGEIARTLQSQGRRNREEIEILGPVPAPLAMIKKQYRWQLLFKGLRAGPLHALARALVNQAERQMRRADVKVIVDVDPMDML